ncbi:MAG: hypothetical protein ACI4FX_00900 [Agathobacter sp.]
MKIAIICDTPLQVLNSINLYYHRYKNAECDIYVSDSFVKSDEIIQNLRKEKLFINVYKYHYISYEESGLKKVLETLWPKKYLLNAIYDRGNYEFCHYDGVFVGVSTIFSTIMMLCSPDAKIYYFEDGMGNYNGSIRIENHKERKIIYKLLHRKYPIFNPSIMYVNNPSLCVKNGINKIKQMPMATTWDNKFKELLIRIFEYRQDNFYKNTRIVYLTQPNDDHNSLVDEVDQEIYQNLFEINPDCIIRKHPRDNSCVPEKFKQVDPGIDMWELICQDCISGNHVLIGQYSTAQIACKMMYDKEPIIIFTYLLYKNARDAEKISNITSAVERIRNSYRDKDRVIVIHDIEELRQIVSQF